MGKDKKEKNDEYTITIEYDNESDSKKNEKENIFLNILELIFGHPIILIGIIIFGFLISMFMGALGLSFIASFGISFAIVLVFLFIFMGGI